MTNVLIEDVFAKYKDRVFLIITPLSCDKYDIYKYLTKYSKNISNNNYLVTPNKKEDSIDQINYEEFLSYDNKYNGKYFIIDNIRFFMYYNIEYFNKENYLIFLLSIKDIDSEIFSYINTNLTFNFFYPKNLCLDINLDYKKISTIIYKNQLNVYKNNFLNSITDKKINKNPSEYLNVYYDDIISSLENINLESALDRAPKFKQIILELILKNKKRHLINMVDGKYGIDAFTIIYNKLDNVQPLVIIKSSDDYLDKIKKLEDFNKDNSPKILLSDFIFTKDMTPKNISVYHMTDGGDLENIYSIFDMIKTINKFSKGDKDFLIINHVATGKQEELTIDSTREIKFNKDFKKFTINYNEFKEKSYKLFLEGNEIKISV